MTINLFLRQAKLSSQQQCLKEGMILRRVPEEVTDIAKNRVLQCQRRKWLKN